MGARIGWKPKSSDPNIASVRFRCLTPLKALQAMGLDIALYDAKAEKSYDLVIFSKLYEPADQVLAQRLRARGCRTLLDLSDNHFYNPAGLALYHTAARNLRAMIALVDDVVCCSAELARVVAAEASPRRMPMVVGDAVEAYALSQRDPADKILRFVWFGSHGSPNAPVGMEDLRRVKGLLERAAAARACELAVVSNNREKFEALAREIGAPMRYAEWSAPAFAREMSHADAIIVPITPNPFTLCKSNNRVATALWHGVPAFADAIPAYEVLRPYAWLDDWDAAFDAILSNDPALRERTSAGQAFVRAHFDGPQTAAAWRSAIETALTRQTEFS